MTKSTPFWSLALGLASTRSLRTHSGALFGRCFS